SMFERTDLESLPGVECKVPTLLLNYINMRTKATKNLPGHPREWYSSHHYTRVNDVRVTLEEATLQLGEGVPDDLKGLDLMRIWFIITHRKNGKHAGPVKNWVLLRSSNQDRKTTISRSNRR